MKVTLGYESHYDDISEITKFAAGGDIRNVCSASVTESGVG